MNSNYFPGIHESLETNWVDKLAEIEKQLYGWVDRTEINWTLSRQGVYFSLTRGLLRAPKLHSS